MERFFSEPLESMKREKGAKAMNILLVAINAKYIHSNLAVYSLRRYAEPYQEHISICEYTINQYVDDILMDIYRKKPELIAFSCYIWNIDMVERLIVELKKVLPHVPIWVGGPEVSYETTACMTQQPLIDGIVVGEGEQTFLELMAYYVDGSKSLQEIDGVVYRDQQGIHHTKPRKPMDLSDIPFPYDNMDEFANKIVYYETSRGCPFSCSYCLSSIEKGIRLRRLDLVKKELQIFLDAKVPQVKFIDRTFNCNHEHAMTIWKYLIEHDNGITNFHFEISADLLNEEELQLLNSMRIGLVQLEIGVQSTNADTIHAIHRTMNLDKLSYAVHRVQEGENIHQHLDLIAGLPYEGYDSFRISFNQVYAWRPNQLQLGFLKVLKGSRMHEEHLAHGMQYKSYAPYEVLTTKWLNFDEVLALKKVENMVEIYYNSGQFVHTLNFLMHFYASPFDFYQSLGEYYEAQGDLGVHHNRIARYHILLQFVTSEKPEITEPLKELLIYDLYLRENLKSRTDFGKNLEGYKEKYHGFYEEMEKYNKQGKENLLSAYNNYQARQMARMTHIEYFTYDLEALEKTGKIKSVQWHILFSYKKRHPLTLEAETYRLFEDEAD